MEETISLQEQNSEIIELTPTVKQDITASAKWSKLCSVVYYIVAALMIIFAVSSLAIPSNLSALDSDFEDMDISNSIMNISKGFLFVVYLLCATVCFVTAFFLMKASKNITNGIHENNQDKIAVGIHNTKNFWQLYGILMLIGAFITIISLLGTVILAAATIV